MLLEKIGGVFGQYCANMNMTSPTDKKPHDIVVRLSVYTPHSIWKI